MSKELSDFAKKYGIDMKLPIIDTLVCIAFAAPEIEVSTMIQDSVGEGDFYTLAKMKEITIDSALNDPASLPKPI